MFVMMTRAVKKLVTHSLLWWHIRLHMAKTCRLKPSLFYIDDFSEFGTAKVDWG